MLSCLSWKRVVCPLSKQKGYPKSCSFTIRTTGTFNVLAYTDKDVEVPAAWQDSDARMIQGNSVEQVGFEISFIFTGRFHFLTPPSYAKILQVKLRGFSTNVHRVDASVAYKLGEDAV